MTSYRPNINNNKQFLHVNESNTLKRNNMNRKPHNDVMVILNAGGNNKMKQKKKLGKINKIVV